MLRNLFYVLKLVDAWSSVPDHQEGFRILNHGGHSQSGTLTCEEGYLDMAALASRIQASVANLVDLVSRKPDRGHPRR